MTLSIHPRVMNYHRKWRCVTMGNNIIDGKSEQVMDDDSLTRKKPRTNNVRKQLVKTRNVSTNNEPPQKSQLLSL